MKTKNLLYLLTKALKIVEKTIETNLTIPQLLVVSSIENGITHQSEIADRIGITRQAIHQVTDELVALGLIERVVDRRNKRAKNLVFTCRGRWAKFRVEQAISSMESHVDYLLMDGFEMLTELLQQFVNESAIEDSIKRPDRENGDGGD